MAKVEKKPAVKKKTIKKPIAKIARHADFLSLMQRTRNKRQRDQLIEMANASQIDSLSNIILNVLRGSVALSKVQHERLHKYKQCLRLLSDKKVSTINKKKQLQKHSGGFIAPLIAAAVPAITSLLGGLFAR